MNTESCRIGIHQPNFAPWLGYFYKIRSADKFVFLDNVMIELNSQQAYVNRTKIKSSAGAIWLTCPVSRALSASRIISEVVFDSNRSWKKTITKTVYFNYKKSKFFDETYPLLENLINADAQHLSVYNINIIKAVSAHLGIDTPLFLASEMNLEASEKTDRIVEICKKLDARIYLSGKGGFKYHDVGVFDKNEITIVDLNFKHTVYPQLHGDFEPGLSVIDVLFNCGKQGAVDLLNADDLSDSSFAQAGAEKK